MGAEGAGSIAGPLHESFAHMREIWLKSAVSSDRRLAFENGAINTRSTLLCPVLSNPGTQWVVVSVGIAQERVVMARSQMPDVSESTASADGRRRHVGVIASEHHGHPDHGCRC